MTEQGAQYDHIGSKYDEYAQTATMKRAESYTVLRMAGGFVANFAQKVMKGQLPRSVRRLRGERVE
jgi:hypothetical protein